MTSQPRNASRVSAGSGRAFGPHDAARPEPAEAIGRDTLSRALGYLRPHARLVLLTAATVVVASALGLLPPLLVRGLLDHGIPAGREAGSSLVLLPYVAGLVAVPLAIHSLSVAQDYLAVRLGHGVTAHLRHDLFRALMDQSLSFYTAARPGELVGRVFDEAGAVEPAVSRALPEAVSNAALVAGTVAVMAWLCWPLAGLAVLSLPAFLIPARGAGTRRGEAARELQQCRLDALGMLQDVLNVGGFLLMRLHGRGPAEVERFAEQNRRLLAARLNQAMAGRWMLAALAAFGVLGPAALYWYGGHLVIAGQASVGTIVAFVAYLANLYKPAARLSGAYAESRATLAAFGRAFEWIDRAADVADAPGAARLDGAAGGFRFEAVSFSYPGAERPALDGVSFAAAPGELVALVGPSGGGKTTAAALLARLYDPSAGRVLIAGHDLRRVTRESIARQVSMVTQETYLFHDTVRANLLYARPSATADELEAACRAAGIHDRLAALPSGYDTLVGERGHKLSGGERQRLSLARAFLHATPILILDEATSSLDSEAEELVRVALAAAGPGRTVLAIAHRLSTVLRADRIVVLDAGRACEVGRHAELLAAGGRYARLYEAQFAHQRAGPLPAAAIPAMMNATPPTPHENRP